MTETQQKRPQDWQARQQAVDISRSCIVQAPAGSGKTELLVQRILALLAVADKPEEILSITFTRKAAGEMKSRLLQALERACDAECPVEEHERETWVRARAVLTRDRLQGWNLLQNPSRLQLMTIDSFCAFLARRMPWLARFGDQPGVTEDPSELYRSAAQALLANLEDGGPAQQAVERLLIHLDNRLSLLRDLLVVMLGRRDQWLRHLMVQRSEESRPLLETSLQQYIEHYLQQTQHALGVESCYELRRLALYALENCMPVATDHPLAALLQKEDQNSLGQWLALAHLVLTATGDIRKSVNKTLGFPADKSPRSQTMKSALLQLLDRISSNPVATDLLQGLRHLPASSYSSGQWLVLAALTELLPLSVVELQKVFREHGQVDFIEIAGAAHAALGSLTSPEDLLLQLDSRLRHILVDEFQDTSIAQYQLLTALTSGWEPGDGRSLFVVGDPMQSIYRFREAEVGLYLRVCQQGLNGLPMDRIVLNTNFRSQKKLVDWANDHFRRLFPGSEDQVRGAVSFAPAQAFKPLADSPEITIHGFIDRQDRLEASVVVALVRQAKEQNPEGTIAVLVRSRSHLSAIVCALQEAGFHFQAQDVDPLVDRPVVRDIMSLTRALCHPADRVAWLSVLRSPWCGLSLEDLTKLCGNDSNATVWQLLTQPPSQDEMFEQLSPAGRLRLDRILPVLKRALENRGRLSLRRLVESTWLALNGPACIDQAALLDAGQLFSLLEDFEIEGPVEKFDKQLGRLFAAPDPQAGPGLTLMTIHKAKGLEFDTVILPGLGRSVRPRERPLLRWMEHPDYGLLLAPVPPLTSSEPEPTYQAIGDLLQDKDDLEVLRLLYVAATRAKAKLHLLGHAKLNRVNELLPARGSLLSVAWPAIAEELNSNVIAAESTGGQALPSLLLSSLPLQWYPPPLPEPLPRQKIISRTATGAGHYLNENVRSWRTEEGRVIGTLVHQWLERITLEGLGSWPEQRIKAQIDKFRAQLNLKGVQASRLAACSLKVQACLINMISSERGRWLLSSHAQSSCELAVNGLIDGTLIHATIDRTFVDHNNMRWIVDYKTTSPADNENPESYMRQEVARYQSQLRLYAVLLEQMGDPLTIRKALYFPMFDGWIVLED